MTELHVRDAGTGDLDAIAAVARAAGEGEEWTGADPAYVRHLLAHGQVVVAEYGGTVVGFGATRRIGEGPAAVTMLCDLFGDARSHGQGVGGAMLTALWQDVPRRMTFSSLHAHAVPLYTRSGLDAWWPLYYLSGDVRTLSAPAEWTLAPAAPEQVADLEREWTGNDRTADHRAWAARPGGRPVIASRHGEPLAAGVVGGAGAGYGLIHLALAPAADDAVAREAVTAVLAGLDPSDGRARVCLPGPHPATRHLLESGWRIDLLDLFMATDPGLLDPRRAVPSPELA